MSDSFPVLSHRFYVIFNNQIEMHFSKISEMTLKASHITPFNEGGANKPYFLRDYQKTLNTLTLEKGFGTLDVLNMMHKVHDMTIVVKQSDGTVKSVFYARRAVVQDVKLSELTGATSQVLIQKMTIVYNNFQYVTPPGKP